jgi:hypothetical protein
MPGNSQLRRSGTEAPHIYLVHADCQHDPDGCSSSSLEQPHFHLVITGEERVVRCASSPAAADAHVGVVRGGVYSTRTVSSIPRQPEHTD